MLDETAYRSQKKWLWWYLSGMAVLLLIATFVKMNRLTTNPRSRIITVQRLVDENTWSHATPNDTTPLALSIDAVQVDGRLYSSKPPIYPGLMALESMGLKAVTGMGVYEHLVDHLRLLVIVNQVFPYLLLLYMAFYFLRHYTQDSWTLTYMLVALGPGMLAFGYAVTINNHTPSAALYAMAFFLVDRVGEIDRRRHLIYMLLGLMIGFSFSIELPSGGIAIWLLLWLWWKDVKWGWIAMVLALIPPLISMALYQYLSGSPKPFYLRSELYDYAGSYWKQRKGIDAEQPGKWSYLFHMLIGFRGLFSMTPILLFGVWASLRRLWGRANGLVPEWLGMWPGILALLVFVVFRTWNYGGAAIGMRWFICFSPLVMLMGWPVVQALGRHLWGRILALGMLAWSIPWNIQALFEEAFVVGWFEQIWR